MQVNIAREFMRNIVMHDTKAKFAWTI